MAFLGLTQEVSGPKISFEETFYSFDTIMQGDDGTHIFEFSNKGDLPLNIISAFSSCGCVVPEWPKHPIMPNEKSSITVKYSTTKIGNFIKSIVVKSNDTTTPKAVIRISGTVIEPPINKKDSLINQNK